MLFRTPLVCLLFLLGCATPLPPGAIDSQIAAWEAPSDQGPVIIGVVTDSGGTPQSGVAVTPHAGFATRFPGKAVVTDDLGRYRLDPAGGQVLRAEDDSPRHRMVGVCVGTCHSGKNPAAVLPWKDVRILDQAGIVERVDFVYEASSE